MRSRSIAHVTSDDLCTAGFVGWWSPVEKLVACLEYPDGTHAFFAHALLVQALDPGIPVSRYPGIPVSEPRRRHGMYRTSHRSTRKNKKNKKHTLPWDGAVGGRIDTILAYTDHVSKKPVRDFLSTTHRVPPLVGECILNSASVTQPPEPLCIPTRIILLSRYRDTIYIFVGLTSRRKTNP